MNTQLVHSKWLERLPSLSQALTWRLIKVIMYFIKVLTAVSRYDMSGSEVKMTLLTELWQ